MTKRERQIEMANRFAKRGMAKELTNEEIRKAVEAEREACAKIADLELFNTTALTSVPEKSSAAWNIANQIRARSKHDTR